MVPSRAERRAIEEEASFGQDPTGSQSHLELFTFRSQQIDEVERNVGAYDQEEFGDDKPLLFLACLVSETAVEGHQQEQRTREYDSLGEILDSGHGMSAFYANVWNDGLCRMAIEDDLLASFTENGSGRSAEPGM